MPQFHFNVFDGEDRVDQDGTDLRDIRSARIEAVRLAGALLIEHRERFWGSSDGWRLEVTDDTGAPLFKLEFVAK